MSALRALYLFLAIIGALLPMLHYLPWMSETGVDLPMLFATWHSNGATSGLYYDLLISALALCVWIIAETYIRKDYWVLICLPITFLIGVSCALPLFLFLRARPVN